MNIDLVRSKLEASKLFSCGAFPSLIAQFTGGDELTYNETHWEIGDNSLQIEGCTTKVDFGTIDLKIKNALPASEDEIATIIANMIENKVLFMIRDCAFKYTPCERTVACAGDFTPYTTEYLHQLSGCDPTVRESGCYFICSRSMACDYTHKWTDDERRMITILPVDDKLEIPYAGQGALVHPNTFSVLVSIDNNTFRIDNESYNVRFKAVVARTRFHNKEFPVRLDTVCTS